MNDNIQAFCANQQATEDHIVTVDASGDTIFTCVDCLRFFKLPKGYAGTMNDQLAAHEKANKRG